MQVLSSWSFAYVRLAAATQSTPKHTLRGRCNSHNSALACMQACPHSGHYTAFAFSLELSLHVINFCKSVFSLCVDPPVRELRLSRHVLTWFDPQHEAPCIYLALHMSFALFIVCFTFELASHAHSSIPNGSFTPTRQRSVLCVTVLRGICIPHHVTDSVSSCQYCSR